MASALSAQLPNKLLTGTKLHIFGVDKFHTRHILWVLFAKSVQDSNSFPSQFDEQYSERHT